MAAGNVVTRGYTGNVYYVVTRGYGDFGGQVTEQIYPAGTVVATMLRTEGFAAACIRGESTAALCFNGEAVVEGPAGAETTVRVVLNG